jgi:hypothetical protein
MGTLIGREIDWFRDISREDEDNDKWGRVYVRFRLNGRSEPGAQLIMLRNAYPESAPKLLYPNAVVVTEGSFVDIDIAVRGREDNVGCGFSLRPGVFSRSSRNNEPDKEMRPIGDKLYAVGPPAKGPDRSGRWRVDHVSLYQNALIERNGKLEREQGVPNPIRFESLAGLETGDRTTGMRAMLMPRSRCDIYAWPVKAYNDLDAGEFYFAEYPPPGTGDPPFGNSNDEKPMRLSQLDTSSNFTPSTHSETESSSQKFGRIAIEDLSPGQPGEDQGDRLGFLSVQFFVFHGSDRPAPGTRSQPL